MALLGVQSGGIGNIGYTPKDMYNVEQQLRAHLIRHDAEMLKEHFEDEKEKMIHSISRWRLANAEHLENQDRAIAKAIGSKLPTIFHRYRIWHISNKFNNKGWVEDAFKDLHDCIWDIESKEEFKARWKVLVEELELVDKTWLQNIYDLCAQWVPTFCKHTFSVRMSSSQRAESCHSFVKQYVHRKHSLIEFII
ncbi:protein FAR1-RELATED SEQUENCE 4-like [Pyrus communis]|uniref:protein FAR1-RELATED SEQUENCE 4-like n=1 Tax=Pyrus communis TaxID=23211 RepID=UPI0035C16D6C